MSRELFLELLDHLVPYISTDILLPNRRMIAAEKNLAITLYFSEGYRIFANDSQYSWYSFITTSQIIHEVCKAITEHLGSKYIRLPRGRKK